MEHAYSEVADGQLDELERGPDADLYNDVLDSIDVIFHDSSAAQQASQAIRTSNGIVFQYTVPGRYPQRVFWTRSADGLRIEAVFPRP